VSLRRGQYTCRRVSSGQPCLDRYTPTRMPCWLAVCNKRHGRPVAEDRYTGELHSLRPRVCVLSLGRILAAMMLLLRSSDIAAKLRLPSPSQLQARQPSRLLTWSFTYPHTNCAVCTFCARTAHRVFLDLGTRDATTPSGITLDARLYITEHATTVYARIL